MAEIAVAKDQRDTVGTDQTTPGFVKYSLDPL